METQRIRPFILRVLLLLWFCNVAASQALTFNVREEQDPGTFVGNVARTSLIYNEFNRTDFQGLRYEIPAKVTKFTIDRETSSVWTATRLNREDECEGLISPEPCVLRFDVSVYRLKSDDSYQLLKVINVRVVIDDVNDNAPEFPSSATILNVPESLAVGEVLRTSGAIDKDSGSNNTIQEYRLQGGGDVFELQVKDNPNGLTADLGIVLNEKLDRETKASYDMKIIAEDGGFPRLSGSVNIRVNVVDINDNRPLFTVPIFEASVPEDIAVKSTILTLLATDPDELENGKLTFSFEPYTSSKIKSQFSINASTGEITLTKALDFEKTKSFRFFVSVKDNGSPIQSSQASVFVLVEDINDNAPQLDLTLPSANVKESVAIGNYIGHISLSDLDSEKSFVDSCTVANDHFRLQRFPDSDSIVTVLLRLPLDFEKSRTEVVNVTCNDGGNPPLFNSTSFTINILDVNDNAPVFTRSSYRFEIQEGNYIGQFVDQVAAIDPDEGENGNVTFSLVKNPEGIFRINVITGVIKAMATLDREQTSSYELEVMARDGGVSPIASTASVTVIVTDVNDNPPKFTKPHFDFKVQENKDRHTIVNTLFARDPDIDSDNHLRFEFTNGFNYSNLFDIDRMTGTIFTLQPLDRELVDSYSFNVKVFDATQPGFVDTSKVTILVQDDNDFKPNITFPNEFNNTFHILYTRAPGSSLLTVSAEDHDTGENGDISFTIIHGNERDLFFINSVTGDLLVAKRMHVYDAGPYHLVVLARDGGSSYLESTRNINIVVTVANGTAGLLNEGTDDTNIAIVIALVCVTSVMALAVIITICIIRRIDRERKHHTVTKIEEENIYKQQVIPGPPMRSDSFENEVEKLKKKIRRDVSFAVEDDSNASDVTNQSSSFTTFKNTTSSSLEHKMSPSPQPHSSVLQNTLSPSETNIKRVHYMDKGLGIDRLTTTTPPPRSQPLDPMGQAVTSSSTTSGSSMRGGKVAHWTGPRTQSPRRSTRKPPVVEDAASHSSGSTSDSGRGCSSEEGEGQPQSHAMMVSLDSETERPALRTYPAAGHLTTFGSPRSNGGSSSGTSNFPRSLSTSLNSDTARKRLWNDSTSSTINSSAIGKNPNQSHEASSQRLRGFLPEKTMSYFKPNISFSDDSVTANTSNGGGGLGSSRNGHQNFSPCPQGPVIKLPTNLASSNSRSTTALTQHTNYSPSASNFASTQRPRYGSQPSPSDSTYRLGITNLSRIPSSDTSYRHGTYVEGPSTDLVDASCFNSNSRSRSYARVHRGRGGGGDASSGPSTGSHRNSYHGGASRHLQGSNLSRVASCENNASQNSTAMPGNNYSLADVDYVLENGSNVTNSHMDDDNSTTTSGSYTINADDLCQEIDHLFFKDVVV